MGTPLMVCARDQWTSCSFCMHAHIKREIVRLDLFGSYSTEAKSAASVSSFAMSACHVDSTFIELPHVHLLKKVNCLNRSLNLIFFFSLLFVFFWQTIGEVDRAGNFLLLTYSQWRFFPLVLPQVSPFCYFPSPIAVRPHPQ